MSDRTGRPVEIDRGDPVSTETQKHRAECQAKIDQHEFQPAQAEEDQQLLQGHLLQQNLELREAHQRSLTEMEELRKFQSSAFDTIAGRKLVEDRNTILELSGRIQELQNEINCMNDSKGFQDAESIRSGNSQVTSRPVSFAPHPIPEEMLSRSIGMPSRREGPPSIWDAHGIYRETFLQIQMRHHLHLILKNCINGIHRPKSRSGNFIRHHGGNILQ